jgi:S-DNA-T family DNA segregation ATPase FtsK/SpoIIIE
MGYARAARIIDQMETEKIIGPSEGARPREIIVDAKDDLKKMEKKKGKGKKRK